MRLCYHCMEQIESEKGTFCPKCGKSLKVESVNERFLKPGTELQSKFVIGYPIGSGGFGNTYIGWNKLLLRKVAIKEFYPEQYSGRSEDGVTVSVRDDSQQPRFRNGLNSFLEEARKVATLQDIPGVVAISNFFEANGTGYIVMEYLEGMDVKTILKKSKTGSKKDYEWSRRVILTVLHTLKEVHKRGVLHRDIAPDNIFVTTDGIIKLIDFGAAKQASATATMNQEVILKVGYAPIEQYSNTAPQGPYTDLYAVAAMFYRMLTGQKPLPANERMNDDRLVLPSEMGIEIPEQAEMAIMVCLNVQPQYRLQSAEEFMEALDGKDYQPVYEPDWILPPMEKDSLGKKIRNMSKGSLAAIAVAAIVILGGAVFVGKQVIDSQNPQSLSTVANGDAISLKDYSGENIDDAIDELVNAGYEADPDIVYEFSDEPEDTIIGQSVEPAVEIGFSDDLTFTVSGGNSLYTMPDFSEMSEDEIVDYFVTNGFDVQLHKNPYKSKTTTQEAECDKDDKKEGSIRLSWDFSSAKEKGSCIDQDVAAGEEQKASDEVNITMSLGKEDDYIKKMPDFKGMTQEAAEKALKDAGLDKTIKIKTTTSGTYVSGVSNGQISAQSIAAGEKINTLKDDGKELTLTIQQVQQKKKSSGGKKKSSGGGSGKKHHSSGGYIVAG